MSTIPTQPLTRRPSIHTSLTSARSRPRLPASTFDIEVLEVPFGALTHPQRPPNPSPRPSTASPRPRPHLVLDSVLEESEDSSGQSSEADTLVAHTLSPRYSAPSRMSPPLHLPPPPQPSHRALPHLGQPIQPASDASLDCPLGRINSLHGYHPQSSSSFQTHSQAIHVLPSEDIPPTVKAELDSPVKYLNLLDDHDTGSDNIPQGNPTQGRTTTKYVPVGEMETKDTLKRERTLLLQRRQVKDYRSIDYKDVSDIRPLRKGGFGEIHTAEWSRLRVVLKRALVDQEEGLEQFEQELEILKRVHDYDFIVPFYGVTVDPRTNVKCMVMKHCTNGNLCSFLKENHANLTWSERYRISIEITKGLEFLHKAGFYHRDLHSANILLDDKRTAMLCDFGLSRSSTKSQTMDIKAAVGVASFLAPERFPENKPRYNEKCDIYSLGVIFWHISSGRIPFERRLSDGKLLWELMQGRREKIVPGTPRDYERLLVRCWDINSLERPPIDHIIGVLQTLMAKPTEPTHMAPTGFSVLGRSTSAALPVPPQLNSRMASLERASNRLNPMIFDIKDPFMKQTVDYIQRTRAYFQEQQPNLEPYSRSNPPKTPIYLCPLVGDIAALKFYLSHSPRNPINESSALSGDTALHLACLFLESPMDTIKVLVELGADINLENLQGYTPVMILVSSNTQYCYEALKFFVVRGARIPAYIRHPITPLNSTQLQTLEQVTEARDAYPGLILNPGTGSSFRRHSAMPHVLPHAQSLDIEFQQQQQQQQRVHHRMSVQYQDQNRVQQRGWCADQVLAQGRPLIHVVAAMQEDQRILDCLCEAGLDPAMTFGGETALVAAAAHLRIKNVEWLLNHDLDISSEAGIQRAIQVVKLLHPPPASATSGHGGHVKAKSDPGRREQRWGSCPEFHDDIRDLGKYSWAGVTYGEADGMSRDMVGPVLNLLEQWTGSRRVAARKEVATKLRLMYGAADGAPSMDPFSNTKPLETPISVASTNSQTSVHSQEQYVLPPPPPPQQLHQQQQPASRSNLHASRSLRKNQKHLIDQVLNERHSMRFWD